MKVTQLENKNQFVIVDKDRIYFQSYESMIAKINREDKKITLYPDYDYSKTTLKHLNLFLNQYAVYEVKNRINNRKGSLSSELKKMIDEDIIYLGKDNA